MSLQREVRLVNTLITHLLDMSFRYTQLAGSTSYLPATLFSLPILHHTLWRPYMYMFMLMLNKCNLVTIPYLLYQHLLFIPFFINKSDNLCVLLCFQGRSASHLNPPLLLTLPDTSALHSWHIASLRSKKHHTADIFPPARNVFYCTKVQLAKVLVLEKALSANQRARTR